MKEFPQSLPFSCALPKVSPTPQDTQEYFFLNAFFQLFVCLKSNLQVAATTIRMFHCWNGGLLCFLCGLRVWWNTTLFLGGESCWVKDWIRSSPPPWHCHTSLSQVWGAVSQGHRDMQEFLRLGFPLWIAPVKQQSRKSELWLLNKAVTGGQRQELFVLQEGACLGWAGDE